MKHYILATSRPWHEITADKLEKRLGARVHLFKTPQAFTAEAVSQIHPEKIFLPHWSHIVPASIFSRWETVIFHMTDLPFGRGGSPLQNLIVRGLTETKVSALRCEQGLDTGPVYLKSPLSLTGSAREIFARTVPLIEDMIYEIVTRGLSPEPQSGEPVIFRRRKPEEGNIAQASDLKQIYDFIRMLDADGYPPAFLEFGDFRLEFSSASMGKNGIDSKVKIIRKGTENG